MRLEYIKGANSVKLCVSGTVRKSSMLSQVLRNITSSIIHDFKLEESDNIFVVRYFGSGLVITIDICDCFNGFGLYAEMHFPDSLLSVFKKLYFSGEVL